MNNNEACCLIETNEYIWCWYELWKSQWLTCTMPVTDYVVHGDVWESYNSNKIPENVALGTIYDLVITHWDIYVATGNQ